jgi:beta-glucosidase
MLARRRHSSDRATSLILRAHPIAMICSRCPTAAVLAVLLASSALAQETLPGTHAPETTPATPAADPSAAIPVIGEAPIYSDPAQPVEKRVADLVRRMSLAEKAAQLRNSAPAIARLGVPAYDYWSEAAHGVANQGLATVFPQAIGNAASWDLANIRAMGHVIGVEGRGKFNDEFGRTGGSRQFRGLTFWAPNINIFRDPRWGRGQETYGEDPFLTARMGVAFIQSVQGDDPNHYLALACAKHYAVHSGPEATRHTANVEPTEIDFWDTYLPHFEAAVREGKVGSVMGAYNRVYGASASGSTLLLTEILRDRWGFKGYVVSDCDAVTDIFRNHKIVPTAAEAAALALKAGDDLECGRTYAALVPAVQQGLLAEADVDRALQRVLTYRFRLGLFDPRDKAPFTQYTLADVDTAANRALALKLAHESIVLLKNDGVLPLDKSKVKRIAVVGPNADARLMLYGNYNGTPATSVTMLEGVRAALGAAPTDSASPEEQARGLHRWTTTSGAQISAAQGTDYAAGNGGGRGGRGGRGGAPTGVVPTIESLRPSLALSEAQAATIAPMLDELTREQAAGAASRDRFNTLAQTLSARIFTAVALSTEQKIKLATAINSALIGESHSGAGLGGRAPGLLALVAPQESGPESADFKTAVALAQESDVVLFFGGINADRFEGEQRDRSAIELPTVQTDLLKALQATGRPVVFVNCSGSAVAMPWEADHLPAIVQAWYPGEAGGTAVADVLFGSYNPAGRLPVTFYRSTLDLPPFADYSMKNRTYRFFTGKPLFAFGHGLSYTKFGYANLKLAAPQVTNDGTINVSVEVTNTGSRDGEEVVQVYAHEVGLANPDRAQQSLVGFSRVAIAKGQKKTVAIAIPASALRHWDVSKKDYIVDAAAYELRVGAASDDIRSTATVRIAAKG